MQSVLKEGILSSVLHAPVDTPQKTIKVLDLCSGLNGWTAAWRKRGHRCVGVEIEAKFRPEIQMDVRHLAKAPETFLDIIVERGWRPDVILASPDCTPFSIASVSTHWDKVAEEEYKPKSEEAVYGLELLDGCLSVIHQLQPDWWWLENPRGMMRKMPQMRAYRRSTITYCSYGETRQKATDLWGRWPETWSPRPMCDARAHIHGLALIHRNGDVEKLPLGTKVRAVKGKLILTLPDGTEFPTILPVYVLKPDGSPCHEAAPRGAQTGTQGIKGAENRSVVAPGLSLETCLATEQSYAFQKPLPLDVVSAVHVPGGKAP